MLFCFILKTRHSYYVILAHDLIKHKHLENSASIYISGKKYVRNNERHMKNYAVFHFRLICLSYKYFMLSFYIYVSFCLLSVNAVTVAHIYI